MARFNFCGPSYSSQSPIADYERTANLYAEMVESSGKSQIALYPTPGLKTIVTIPSGAPIEAMVYQQGAAFTIPASGVSGTFYFRLQYSGGGVFTSLSTPGVFTRVAPAQRFVQMAAGSGSVIMTVDGNVLRDNSAGATPVAAANFNNLPVSQVGYCDGFFLALNQNSNQWYASSLLDPATWPGAATAKVNVFPDNVVAMIVNQRQVLMLGQTASQVYFNSGNFPFPFDIVQGGYIEAGCAAAASAAKLDNSIFWLGFDQRGWGMVWRLSGYTPQRVSNHAIEFAMQGYSNVTDAIAYTYQDQGHSFYQLYFPSANGGNGATWDLDVATGLWHERFFWNQTLGIEQAHRSRCHVLYNATGISSNADGTNYHLVGDWQNTGNIYQMAIPSYDATGSKWQFADDFGNAIRRVRRAPHINLEKKRIFHKRLEFDMETGIGPIPPITTPSVNPTRIVLQAPNNGLWQVQINDGGAIVTSSIAAGTGTVDTVTLTDSVTGANRQLAISNTGVLSSVASASSLFKSFFLMASSGTALATGLGVVSGTVTAIAPLANYRGPNVNLRYSNDGGKVWSNYNTVDAGQIGKYSTRIVFRRLGYSRQRVYELSWADPVPLRIIDAYLEADPIYQPEERLVKKLAKSA